MELKLISKKTINTLAFNPIQSWHLHLIGFEFDSKYFIGKITDSWNDIHWYKNGKRHREDGPAVEKADGSKIWYKEGKIHRLDGPAVKYSNGDEDWYKDGVLHREDGPAIESLNGESFWYKNGNLIINTTRKENPHIRNIT